MEVFFEPEQLCRRMGGGGRSSGGRRQRYELHLKQWGGGKRRFWEGEQTALVTNQSSFDSLRVMSSGH
jgi:hypothetical protein